MIIHNLKAHAGKHIESIKMEDWFKALDLDTQKMILQNEKDAFTSPNATENAWLNVWIENSGLWGEWELLVKEEAPWTCPTNGLGGVALAKKHFISERAILRPVS